VYSELLAFLRCLSCHRSLEPQRLTRNQAGEIVGGMLACSGCDAHYPIRDGIADFLPAPAPPTPAQIVNELPPTAWVYERGWRPFALTLLSGQPFSYRRELPLVVRLVEPERGGLYLDIACSNGLYARALTRAMRGATGHVAAIDHAMPMLRQARRYALDAGLRISFLRAKAQALPIVPEAAAGAVIGGSLNEIVDLDGCLSEVRRTLASSGRYLAMTLTRAGTPSGRVFQQLMGAGGIEFWAPNELEAAFARHSLRTAARWKFGLVMFHLALPE
jgi:ubiquinone/menaquinone biosynthesis C-methylase UbiE/uncharacterized protein YbaR (Trm112 family)